MFVGSCLKRFLEDVWEVSGRFGGVLLEEEKT